MIFNERDQLEELELLYIFEMYQSKFDTLDDSSPKVKEKNYQQLKMFLFQYLRVKVWLL